MIRRTHSEEPGRPMLIRSELGVSTFNEDTQEFAEFIARDTPRTLLDVGTGTGYIAVRLALIGCLVSATDISRKAKALAEQNAELNGVRITVRLSDLFNAVEGQFDAIAFNPPFSPKPDRYPIAILKQLVRRIGPLERALMHHIPTTVESFRRALISRFVADGESHLTDSGSLYLLLYRPEMAFVENLSTELVLRTRASQRLAARNLTCAKLTRPAEVEPERQSSDISAPNAG